MKKNVFIALGLLVLIVIWLGSGIMSDKRAVQLNKRNEERELLLVEAQEAIPEKIQHEVVFSGKTAPARKVVLRAEIDGRVLLIGAKRGDLIQEGEVICKIDERDLPARLIEKQELVKQRALEHKASKDLFKKEFIAETKVAEALTDLANAKAAVKSIQIDLENTLVKAPFKGELHDRNVEIGDYLKKGDEIATVIETNPLIVTGEVSENEIKDLVKDIAGYAVLATGKIVHGMVRYVSPESDAQTRSFTVELEVDNGDYLIPAGLTANIHIPTKEILGYKVSPQILSLDVEGTLGVKAVGEDSRVRFIPVKIERSTEEAVWISGVPKDSRLITLGQGFAEDGDIVRVAGIEGESKEDE